MKAEVGKAEGGKAEKFWAEKLGKCFLVLALVLVIVIDDSMG